MFYTLKEIDNEYNEILKSNDNYITYNDFNEIDVDKNNRNHNNLKINHKIKELINNINFNLFNDVIDYNKILDISIVINPIIEIVDDKYISNDIFYYLDLNKSISYYEYNNLCFKTIEDLKQYIFNQYQHYLYMNNLFYYNFEIDIDEIKKIFYFFDDDIKENIYKYEDDKTNEIYEIISDKKINVTDEIYINCYVENTIEDLIDNLYDDLFNNFLNDDLKKLIKYKNFIIFYDDRLINYIKDDYLFDIDIDVDEIKNYLIDENINYHYKNYLNRYYDLFKNIPIYYHIEIYKNKEYINKDFKDDDDVINYLTSLY